MPLALITGRTPRRSKIVRVTGTDSSSRTPAAGILIAAPEKVRANPRPVSRVSALLNVLLNNCNCRPSARPAKVSPSLSDPFHGHDLTVLAAADHVSADRTCE